MPTNKPPYENEPTKKNKPPKKEPPQKKQQKDIAWIAMPIMLTILFLLLSIMVGGKLLKCFLILLGAQFDN